MAYPVYSTRLFAGRVNAGTTYTRVLTVPAGHRIVIRDVHVLQGGGTGNATLFRVAGIVIECFRVYPDTATSSGRYEGMTVLHENEGLEVSARNLLADIYMSGHIFTGTGGPMSPSVLPA